MGTRSFEVNSSIQRPSRLCDLPTWFAITTPEFYAVAFAMGLVALALRRRTTEPVNARGSAIIAVAIALPITGAVITKPALYDGLRHFLFVFPPMAAPAGIAVSGFTAAEAIPWVARAAGLSVLVVAAGTTLVDMTVLHPNQYAILQPIVRRPAGGQGPLLD